MLCASQLVIGAYGGGIRYHCPVCDVRTTENGQKLASWTNGQPPASRLCDKQLPTTRRQRLEAKGLMLRTLDW